MKRIIWFYSLSFAFFLSVVNLGCQKDIPKTLPILTTTDISCITDTSAASGGVISSDGNSAIIERGVCWALTANPTIVESKTNDGTGSGTFISRLLGLKFGTIYHLRAFAINSIGIAYGNDITITTNAIVPIISTSSISLVKQASAQVNSNIISNGGSSIITHGICWSANQTPTITDLKTTDSLETGDFNSPITDLKPNTTYYVRAYASNSVGIGYGNVLSFKTLEDTTVIDIDGNIYNIIAIGAQVWMKENLQTTRYRNGDTIGTTWPASLSTFASTNNYQWAYDGNENNIVTYGRVYTWYAVTDNRKLCPIGWHVSNESDWMILGAYLGGYDNAGGKLKELGDLHWTIPNTGATNETEFTALPGGWRYDDGTFSLIGNKGYWWTPNSYHETLGIGMSLNYNNAQIETVHAFGSMGYSVRCVRD